MIAAARTALAALLAASSETERVALATALGMHLENERCNDEADCEPAGEGFDFLEAIHDATFATLS